MPPRRSGLTERYRFDDPARAHFQDAVGGDDGGEPMRDYDGRAALRQLPHGPAHRVGSESASSADVASSRMTMGGSSSSSWLPPARNPR